MKQFDMKRMILLIIASALLYACDKPETITIPDEDTTEQTPDVKGEHEEEEEIPIFAPIDNWRK